MDNTETTIKIVLSRPQMQFKRLDKKYRAFVGGYRSGKTWVGCTNICDHIAKYPRVSAGYFVPTYPMLEDIFYPTIESVAPLFGFKVEINRSKKRVFFFRYGKYYGECICRSMEQPERIVGFKIGYALIDEIDLLPKPKADIVWNKVAARMSYAIDGLPNRIDVTTTPEGYGFAYNKFVANKTDSYGIVHASTRDNAKNLPPDYIPSLIETYPSYLIDAYLEGRFVNLTAGTVYHAYKRDVHDSNEEIRPGDRLFIGQDFNVGKMCSAVLVQRNNVFHVVDQLTGVMDTPALCKLLTERYRGHEILIYPDATGGARKTVNSSMSDIMLLKSAGFIVRVNNSNPAVRDRVVSINNAFERGLLRVNARKCREVSSCLEKQAYDTNGEPDKAAGFDHMNDALGYFVTHELPVRRPALIVGLRTGS
ncbi:MAG: terminase large subunit [Chitinispirillales bacterium]|jgi:hypothetical protein|nr:terminase large subunit [Chitinispirillales bacterium]